MTNHTAQLRTMIATEELVCVTDFAGVVGYFPRSTIERWRALGRAIVDYKIVIDETRLNDSTEPENATSWLTVTEAARLHLDDVDGICLGTAKGKISRACDKNDITSNGKTGRHRLIDPISLNAWRLNQREMNLDRADRRCGSSQRPNLSPTFSFE